MHDLFAVERIAQQLRQRGRIARAPLACCPLADRVPGSIGAADKQRKEQSI